MTLADFGGDFPCCTSDEWLNDFAAADNDQDQPVLDEDGIDRTPGHDLDHYLTGQDMAP